MPSILGFIALATAGNEVLRGKAAARFEGATLAGLGVGFIVAPKLFEAIGPTAFFLNAVVYGVSFLIYWRGVKDPAGEAEAVASPHVGCARYVDAHPVARTSCSWHRPGSRSTPASGCGSASRSSSSRRPTRSSPTSS